MIYGYIRVSTAKQDVDNQKLEIQKFCKKRGIRKVEFVSEIVSGTKSPEKRKLGLLIKNAQKGDVVITVELSRLGRSLLMILNVLQSFLDKGIEVWTVKEGFILGDNIQSKVIAFAFGLSAEIERQLISERTKAGLAMAIKRGRRLGRPKGFRMYLLKLYGKESKIRELRKDGKSKSEIVRNLGVTWVTLDKYMRKIGVK